MHSLQHQLSCTLMVGSLKINTTLEYSTRVVQEGDRRCKKSTLNDLAYLTPLRIPLMNPVSVCKLYNDKFQSSCTADTVSSHAHPVQLKCFEYHACCCRLQKTSCSASGSVSQRIRIRTKMSRIRSTACRMPRYYLSGCTTFIYLSSLL
jgi:hypothetical protein